MIKEFANIGDIPVSQIMQKGFFNVKHNSSVRTAIDFLQMNKMSCAPVVDSNSQLVGIISEHDLLIQAATKPMGDTIHYSEKVSTVSPDTTIKDVLIFFYKNKLNYIPVVDRMNNIRGMVSRIDLLSYLAKNSP